MSTCLAKISPEHSLGRSLVHSYTYYHIFYVVHYCIPFADNRFLLNWSTYKTRFSAISSGKKTRIGHPNFLKKCPLNRASTALYFLKKLPPYLSIWAIHSRQTWVEVEGFGPTTAALSVTTVVPIGMKWGLDSKQKIYISQRISYHSTQVVLLHDVLRILIWRKASGVIIALSLN